MTTRVSPRGYSTTVWALTVVLATATVATQTRIKAPKNSYSVAEDVKLGQEAAAEVRKELPLLRDERLDQYIEGIGARLAAAIPSEFQHPEFRYTFDIVNQSEINAFALPGGPMFLNRGMMEKAGKEAEMAGVMGHELAHVALRHGTAQATKSSGWQLGSAVGQILGAVVGGGWGSLIGATSQIVPGVVVMKYSREFESQADILGAQMLARAGYDPREMANMFKTIQAEGGGGGPEWFSSHPDPGNRYNAIVKEASSLRVEGRGDTGQFEAMQARLDDMGPSYTAEQIAKGQAGTTNTGNTRAPAGGRAVVNVEPPSNQLRTQQPAKFLRVGVPSNWNQVSDRSGATYAPEGAVFDGPGGQTAFTHGVQFGVTQGSGNLQRDTDALIQSFAKSNPQLQVQRNAARDRLDGRQALTVQLRNVSDVTGQQEVIALTTAMLPDNNLFFMIGVAPQSEASVYSNAFQRVKQSVRLTR